MSWITDNELKLWRQGRDRYEIVTYRDQMGYWAIYDQAADKYASRRNDKANLMERVDLMNDRWRNRMRKEHGKPLSENPRRGNGRSYVRRGRSLMRYEEPVAGQVFYLGGRKGEVKRVGVSDGTPHVWFKRPVDGTFAMSVGNFRQAAYVEDAAGQQNPSKALPLNKWLPAQVRRVGKQIKVKVLGAIR